MRNALKKIFTILICLPVIFLCSCGGVKPTCDALPSVSYYYGNSISCNIFNQDETKTINTTSITNKKLNKDMLDAYAQFTLNGKSAEMYHLYIEYIYFKIYTNEDSEFQLDINVNLTNVIKESDIGNSELKDEDKVFTNTYAAPAKKKGTVQVKIEVKRTVATATGSKLTIDVLTSDMFAEENSTFKWCIYDFKIYGESRSY